MAWYLPDRLGTIRDLINNSGSIIDHVDYSAFGTVLGESSPSNGDRMMGFAGLDAGYGHGAEPGDASGRESGTGRWTSQDPLGFEAEIRTYIAMTNEPTIAGDPTGTDIVLVPTVSFVWGLKYLSPNP